MTKVDQGLKNKIISLHKTHPKMAIKYLAPYVELSVATMYKACKELNIKVQRTYAHGQNMERVATLRKNNPCATLQEIGDITGITRERVRQLLNVQKLQTIHWKTKHFCVNCGKEIVSHNKFCSEKCRHKFYRVPVVCSGCGKLFHIRQSELIARMRHNPKGLYCSYKCFSEHKLPYNKKDK